MHRTVTQELAPSAVLTDPRALRHQRHGDDDPKITRLMAALELKPFDDDCSELEAALAALEPANPTPAPPTRSVPRNIAHAMHRVALAAGDLIQQSRMELALEVWLGWNPAAFNPKTKHATYAGGRARYRSSIASTPQTPSTRDLRQQLRDAHSDLLDTPDSPSARQAYARALANLSERQAESAHARSSRLLAPDAIPYEPAAAAPITLSSANLAPPGEVDQTRALSRRANLTVRPSIERLTATLALAPGAPSRTVCAV